MNHFSRINLIVAVLICSLQSFGQAQGPPIPFQPYSQNFEGLDANDATPTVLGDNENWWVGGLVTDAAGAFQYDYFSFPAPNSEIAFSSILTGLGGPAQGNQHLNIFSDYNNQDHGNQLTINTFFFRQYRFDADDVGTQVDFTFDFRRAEDPFGPGGSMVTCAYARILDDNNGFALVFEDIMDTTNATIEWTENATISFNVDPGFEGMLIQFGFSTSGTNFDPSGVLYDNIIIGDAPDCILGDVNGDGVVTLLDVAGFIDAIGSSDPSCPADVDENGVVDLLDVTPFINLLSGN